MKKVLSVLWCGAVVCGVAQADDWEDCAGIASNEQRLACFDQKARQFADPLKLRAPPPAPKLASEPTQNDEPVPPQTPEQRAEAQPSDITRFWDLEHATARDTFELRAYRPVTLGLVGGSNVNTQPTSPSEGRTASDARAYRSAEVKLNLSVRTKVVSGALRSGDDPLRDSLWFGYTQQSYWQLFTPDLSRPFRSTDHEPELVYVFPQFLSLPGGWTYRMTGAGVVHQSNGQSLPLSRSWNRVYLVAAADKIAANGDRFTLQARLWQRLDEKPGSDDNPDISKFIGRGEIAGRWSFDQGVGEGRTVHALGLTVRSAFKANGRGSTRLEYLRSLGRADDGLRFYTELFSGYGHTLIDYNVRRTVLTMGLSLIDW